MEKTGQMIEFEEETGGYAIVTVKVGFAELQFPSEVYVEWLEAELLKASVKATTYNRIMSGGRKTLKEWANIFGKPVATQKDGDAYVYMGCPVPNKNGDWVGLYEGTCISMYFIDFTGDWKDSLTLPDGWEEK